MNKKITYLAGGTLLAAAIVALPIASTSYADTASTTINGTIGSTLTVSSNSPVTLATAPTSGAVTTSAYDTVSVSTNNTSGYTLSLETSTADRTLKKGSDTIAVSAGSLASPTSLTANHWGYRVDGAGGFSGTTTAETNVSSSAFSWAGVPASGSSDTIKTTTTPATNEQTKVWYAMSADTSKPSGAYTNSVVYTATARP